MRCERNTVIVRCRRLHCSALRDPFGTIAIRSRNVAGGCRRRMSPPDIASEARDFARIAAARLLAKICGPDEHSMNDLPAHAAREAHAHAAAMNA